jgi:hypothetical protein
VAPPFSMLPWSSSIGMLKMQLGLLYNGRTLNDRQISKACSLSFGFTK